MIKAEFLDGFPLFKLLFNFRPDLVTALENNQYFGLAQYFYALDQLSYKHIIECFQLELFILYQLHYFINLCLSFF